MPKISETSVNAVLGALDIIDVLSDYLTLKKSGSNYKANCPFHDEKTPSFMVSPNKGIYKCFGCGKSGNALRFVMDHEQLTFIEAIKLLGKKYNVELIEEAQSPEQVQLLSKKEKMYVALDWAKNLYISILNHEVDGKIAREYIKSRGISPKAQETFGLGLSPKGWDSLLRASQVHKLDEGVLNDAGLIVKREEKTFDFFRERLMFPIIDTNGRVLGFGGRDLKGDGKGPKYINTPQTEVYDKSNVLYGLFQAKRAVRNKDRLILTEGYTDVIALHQAGIEEAVSASGTALTEGHIHKIKRFTKNVVLLFDGDGAGKRAAKRGIELCLRMGLFPKVCLLPEDHDPDSYIHKFGGQHLTDHISTKAQDAIYYELSLLAGIASTLDPQHKAGEVEQLLGLVSYVTSPIQRGIYIKQIGHELSIDEEILHGELRRIKGATKAGPNRPKSVSALTKPYSSRKTRPQQYLEDLYLNLALRELNLIRILVEHGHRPYDDERSVTHFVLDSLADEDLQTPLHQRIFARLREGSVQSEKLIHDSDIEIAQHCTSIYLSEYSAVQNYESLSLEGWRKRSGPIVGIDQTYKSDVDREIQWFEWELHQQLEFEWEMRYKDAVLSEEETLKMLALKQKINALKVKTSNPLGICVRRI
ncbi:MAG: DNA primase [Bacteroidetes bacterium]|nr:MAG: DNA primase [Bacteroidota bacterium]